MYSFTINLAVWTGFNILEKTSYVCVACFWSYIVVLIGKIYGGYIGDVKPVAHMIGEKREPTDTREFISTSILCILIYKNVYIETLSLFSGYWWRIWLIFYFWCFHATFSNISAISWRPVLVVEEAGVPGENHRPWASNW